MAALNQIEKVWEESRYYLAESVTSFSKEEIQLRLATLFCPGPFYYYIFDFSTMKFTMVSPRITDLLGFDAKQVSYHDVLGRIHPDDINYCMRCESRAGEFLFREIPPEELLNYKVSYCFRMKNAQGEYAMFLHQAMGLTRDSEGRLGKVMGVHSDISHITQENSYRLSLLGLNGAPDYVGLPIGDLSDLPLSPSKSPVSVREKEILRFLSEGATAKEISKLLNIADSTVRKHRENLLRKTGARNSAHLIAYAIKEGIV